MKHALERMDSALLFAIAGQEARARDQFQDFRPAFEASLRIERGNVTLLGEGRLADELASLHARYLTLTEKYLGLSPSVVGGSSTSRPWDCPLYRTKLAKWDFSGF